MQPIVPPSYIAHTKLLDLLIIEPVLFKVYRLNNKRYRQNLAYSSSESCKKPWILYSRAMDGPLLTTLHLVQSGAAQVFSEGLGTYPTLGAVMPIRSHLHTTHITPVTAMDQLGSVMQHGSH